MKEWDKVRSSRASHTAIAAASENLSAFLYALQARVRVSMAERTSLSHQWARPSPSSASGVGIADFSDEEASGGNPIPCVEHLPSGEETLSRGHVVTTIRQSPRSVQRDSRHRRSPAPAFASDPSKGSVPTRSSTSPSRLKFVDLEYVAVSATRNEPSHPLRHLAPRTATGLG